jgi:subtilisin family serine protease
MMPDGSPTGNHGTACAGIATASINNATGVAGLAGECLILPVAFQNWTDVEVAAGIRYAAQNGARVISMSFGWDPWDHAIIDPAIQEAFDLNVIMCVATHNHDAAITYPATNPLVMACGASDQVDNRKSPTSPDGEGWGSNFGPAMSVVAPGVLIPTTDRTGNVGYTIDDYMTNFNGTSSATPHVAGLAALLLSRDKTLGGVEVRTIIEQTADKVGAVPYAPTPGYPNGTWNQEMGYGRINAYKAVQSVPTMAVAGNWTLFYDWLCDGTYNTATMTVNTDGTWTNSEGSTGLWTQDAGLFTFTFDDLETTYAGNLASKSITGTSTTFTGLNGCFYMLQEGVPTAFAAKRVAGQRDAAGNE